MSQDDNMGLFSPWFRITVSSLVVLNLYWNHLPHVIPNLVRNLHIQTKYNDE